MPGKSIWETKPDESLRRLGTLMLEGLSGEQIASEMNAHFKVKLTRNAVTGKVNRARDLLKQYFSEAEIVTMYAIWQGRASGAGGRPPPPKRQRGTTGPKATPLPPQPYTVTAPPLPKPEKKVRIEDLDKGLCYYGYGDPDDPDFTFCGRAAAGRYCKEHEEAMRPQQAPRKKKSATVRDESGRYNF